MRESAKFELACLKKEEEEEEENRFWHLATLNFGAVLSRRLFVARFERFFVLAYIAFPLYPYIQSLPTL